LYHLHRRTPHPLPCLLSHWGTFAGTKAFEQLLLKPLLFQALDVLTDEPPEIIFLEVFDASLHALLFNRTIPSDSSDL
jgi:hypothetical protein